MSVYITYEVELEYTAICNACNKDVEASLWKGEIVVEPCEYCLALARGEEEDES